MKTWLAVAIAATAYTEGAMARDDLAFAPSLTVAVVRDDNVLVVPQNQQSDTILRVTPALTLDYQADAVSLQTKYSQDLERYDQHDEFNSTSSREEVQIDGEYRLNPKFSVGATGGYLSTPSPFETLTGTTLQAGRINTRRVSGGVRTGYRFTPTIRGGLQYTATSDHASGGIDGSTRELAATYTQSLSPTFDLLLADTFRRFRFDNAREQHSHTPTAGMAWQFDRSTSVRLQAGPRLGSDSVKPDVTLVLRRDLATGSLDFNYARSQAVVPGISRPLDTELVSAGWNQNIDSDWKFSVTPGWGKVSGPGSTGHVQRLDLGTDYRLTAMLTLNASYQYNRQKLQFAFGDPVFIPRNMFVLGFSLVPPIRK